MASGQRAFTQKLSKQHAADVRRNVAGISGKPGPYQGSYTTGWSSDVVEPLDYEDFLSQHHMLVNRDPLSAILDFPHGDVDVAFIPRTIRTLHPVVPEEKLKDLVPHVQACVCCYTSDWKVVNHQYRQYSSSVATRICSPHHTIIHSSPRQEFEIDFQTSAEPSDTESFSGSSRQSIASSISSCTDTLTPRNSWASFDLRNSVGDPLISELLERTAPESVDQLNESRRQEDRQESLFGLYSITESDEPIERRLLAEPPMEHQGHRILVKCVELNLGLSKESSELEPFFASMALYDAREKKKLSENFYFDLNTENVKRMLGGHVPYSDMSSLSRGCVFDITHLSPDLYIVVRVEKVLQGDINECIEPYLKDDKANQQKVKDNAVVMCERLGKYRQPFAWTAVYLMNVINGKNSLERDSDSTSTGSSSATNSLERKVSNSGFDQLRRRATDMGSLTRRGSLERRSADKRRSWSPDNFATNLETFRPITLTVSSFFKQESEKLKDEDLYKFLPELKRPCQIMKKLKCIPGSLKLDISPCPQEVKYALTPELAKLMPYPDDKVRPIKELLEFPAREILMPHYTYRNLLFVSPKELNFSNRTGSARNIAVRIQLMCGENQENALSYIYGKSSCPEFTNEAYSAVTYHNKCPTFYDEIKIKLPAALGDQHHLLFTFYHISCQRKVEQTTVDTPVGYTWLPLTRDGMLVTGEFCLPVMLEPPPLNYSYIPPDVCLPGMKWLDNHKGVFSVNLDAVSSIHTQDKHLERFLTAYDYLETGNIPSRIGDNMENEFKTALSELGDAKPEALVKNLPLMLDTLLKVLVQPPSINGHVLNVGPTVFEALCTLLKNVTKLQEIEIDQHNRASLLSTYIQFQCNVQHPFSKENSSYNSPSMKRSTSNPDLYADTEVEQLARGLDRTASMRTGGNMDVTYYSTNPYQRILHEEIALQWVVSSGQVKDVAMNNSWFLFELMAKSMVEHLAYTRSLDEPRKNRFPEQFTDDLTTLVHNVTSEIIAHFLPEPRLARNLNTSLAFFLFDLFSVMDRGYVLNQVKSYCKQISAKIISLPDAVALVELKLEFVRIVCSHEHYVALNLPFATPYTISSAPVSPSPSIASSASQTSFLSGLTNQERASSYSELSIDYRQQHYLTGLILSDLTAVLEMQSNALQSKAVATVRNLLSCHDNDPRYVAPEFKMRVAALYIPLLTITMDKLPLLYHWQADNRWDKVFGSEDYTTSGINQNVALAIAGKLPPPNYDNYQQQNRKAALNAEVTRHLLVCVLWTLKNLDKQMLSQWLSELSVNKLTQFLQVLDVCITCFEYKGKKEIKRLNQQQTFHKTTDIKSKLEDVILGQGSARSEMMQRRKERIAIAKSGEQLRWRKEQMAYRSSVEHSERPSELIEVDAHIEGNLATEATFIILDMLEKVVQVVSSCDVQQAVVGTILKILLHALACNQSTTVLPHMFATQRSLVFKFHSALFDEETEQCADLCLLLLKHCGSCIASVRSQAAASLYLLMRQTFEIGNNFARIKMQVTMSLSSLVGTNANFSEEYLKRSLKTILEYGERDVELQDTTFPEQVHDLVFNLHMILSDTVKMKEYQEDPEMLLDLMYRIAKGYQNSPDLRLTWLANMAQKHMERNNHTEAGMCLVHSAALVAEYLAMLEPLSHLPAGAVALERVSPNVLSESAVSDDVLSPEQEGFCLGSHFTEGGLLGLLEHAASSFHSAGMYEPMNDIYRVYIPIAEHNRDFKKLANIHGKLHEAYTRIEQLQGKRVFGTYFRVGFYGQKFGDLDQEEFIYKEPTLTKLPEIFSRLENFYAERFGSENIVIIKDSNTVDVRTLDPEKAYIQITYVEPYFEPYELRYRQTHFDKNFNIKRFVYATPFTPTGKAHGELHEQCKRKTILTTAMHFPYVKTRIQVVHRKQIILSPIEVAIEDIQKKTNELAAAIQQEPPDPKILQMVLQGCIGTTVNQGPMEMALVFLSGIAEGKQLTKHQNKLRLCFKDFSKKCHDALRKNKNLIGLDQRDYQRELERNYKRFTERLQPLVNIDPQLVNLNSSSGLTHTRYKSSDSGTLRW